MTLDRETLDLLRPSLRSMFAEQPADLGAALEELGWSEVVAADADTAHALLLAEHGRALSTLPALDTVAAGALGLPPTTRFVWPYFERAALGAPFPCSGRLEVRGLLMGDAPGRALFACGGGVVCCELAGLEVTPLRGIDPSAGWHVVSGSIQLSAPEGVWAAAEVAATRALAAELLALAEAALEVAIAHVSSRQQFGQSIGSFQGVRHRLATAYASLAGARSLLAAATTDARPEAARLAKAAAGRAHDIVAREAVQVCGAIGLSAEFPLVGYMRRGFLLDAFLTSSRDELRATGRALLDGSPPAVFGQF